MVTIAGGILLAVFVLWLLTRDISGWLSEQLAQFCDHPVITLVLVLFYSGLAVAIWAAAR